MLSNTTRTRIPTRYFDVGILPTGILEPIQDFQQQLLVSLEVAVEPLVNIVPNVQKMVLAVKALCPTRADNLSTDESASIMLYSLEWTSTEDSFYIILNKTLRSKNQEESEPWSLYLRLFLAALSKLPSTIGRTVYRGVKVDISNQYIKGETCVELAFSSCSSSVEIIKQFLGQTGLRTIFAIRCNTGKDIRQHSCHPAEDEILLLAGTHFTVVANLDEGNGLHIIQLEEIHCPTSSSYHNQQLANQIDKCSIHFEIDLREQKLTDEDMKCVAEQAMIKKQCTELHLQHNMITSQGLSIIALGIKNNKTLQKLWLDSNSVNDKGVETLVKILEHNQSTLKMLGLNSNQITDEGAKHLAEMLKTNTTLTFLRLSHNAISDQGVQFLADALTHHNNTLESIDLSSNKLLTDRSITYLIQMIKRNQSLSSLNISNCCLSENGKQIFRPIGQSKCGFNLCV